jgi:hypothetical protein
VLDGTAEGMTSEGVAEEATSEATAEEATSEGVAEETASAIVVLVGAGLDSTAADDEAVGLGSVGFSAPAVPGTMFCFNIRSAWVTSKADSCWPTPVVPSQEPVNHLLPHITPPSPPEQALAAPIAEVVNKVVTLSFVKGAKIAVFAMKRAR